MTDFETVLPQSRAQTNSRNRRKRDVKMVKRVGEGGKGMEDKKKSKRREWETERWRKESERTKNKRCKFVVWIWDFLSNCYQKSSNITEIKPKIQSKRRKRNKRPLIIPDHSPGIIKGFSVDCQHNFQTLFLVLKLIFDKLRVSRQSVRNQKRFKEKTRARPDKNIFLDLV